jgi:pyruvate formate lyase activating enzyme
MKQYSDALRTMKGGLTVSGGEPLMQRRFLLKLFGAAHSLDVHTALDTNGYLGDRLNDEDLASIDLVMLGLKALSPGLHKKITGMENEPVIAFARRLAARGHPMWIRFVVVPGWSDDIDEVGRIADFAAELGNVQRVDVLPFHQMGRFKWERLGMDYQLRDTQPPSRQKVDEVIACFRATGLNVV